MNLFTSIWGLLAAWCWITLGCYFLRRGRSYAALFFTCLTGLMLLLVTANSLASVIDGIRELVR